MSAYSEFFLKSKRSIVQLELLKIWHPNFSQPYCLVRNSASPVAVILENGVTEIYSYAPMKIKQRGSRDDLDSELEINLGDLGDILAKEIPNLNAASEANPATGYAIRPSIEYRQYRSDVLTTPLFGPLYYEMPSFAYKTEASTFIASAPRLNIDKTGEIYTLERFPMLRGFMSYNTYYTEPEYLEFVAGGIIDLMSGEQLEAEDSNG